MFFKNDGACAETIKVFLGGYFSCEARAIFDLPIKPASINALECQGA